MMSGPSIVTDIVDVYVFRRAPEVELLQLRRTKEPYSGSWQPVMGRIEPGERPEETARRELAEETGARQWLGLWLLDQVHPFYDAGRQAIVLSVRFGCEMAPDWSPTLKDEHDDWRWTSLDEVDQAFMWPGQRASIRDLRDAILTPGSLCRDALRVDGHRT